ncbi:hypothetical protein ACSBR1_019019 [Camellia fascicularis]
MIFISIRTDMAWYRLGKPAKQYSPWYEPVLKTARLAISIITLLKEQIRVSRLSFSDVIMKVSEFDKDHPGYISSNPEAVERYVVVHGQIILQQFAEFPDDTIRKCAFVTGLHDKMEERHHTKWLVKKKTILEKEANLNPRAAMAPVTSKRNAMPATTRRLINRIWGEYYSNYSPEDSKESDTCAMKDDEIEEQEEGEEDEEEDEEEKGLVIEQTVKPDSGSKQGTLYCSNEEIEWDGEAVGSMPGGGDLYKRAIVRGSMVSVGGSVLLTGDSEEYPPIYFVEYMFEESDGSKVVHGRLLMRGSQTVLGNTANEREVFMTNDCLEFELADIVQTVVVKPRLMPWGYQHRKSNAANDKADRARADNRKSRGLPMEYFCKKVCIAWIEVVSSVLKLIAWVLVPGPRHFGEDGKTSENFKGGRNVGLKAYVVCHLLEIEGVKTRKQADPESMTVKVRRFFRPKDISSEKAYRSDIQEVYYSEQIVTVPLLAIEGKCKVRRKQDLPFMDAPEIFQHIFFCEYFYDHHNGAIKQLPAHIKLTPSKERVVDDATIRKKKGKCKEGGSGFDEQKDASSSNCLATLDIFAGCGGLSEGLQRSGVSLTKWAIEYEEPAGEAFKLNHPEALMLINNCNVILRAIMTACGDEDDCISTPEAAELAAKLDEKEINNLPRPGQVDFINGGPPCQGFSGMNRFNHGAWSKVQCEMILAFLSFAEYFRPKFFLLENVRNLVSYNKGQTFRLTLASLLEMGYQVRFGILEAGAYGVSQSRKRAFIWAASPEETLPEWPEPMHVFAGPELKISLNGKSQYVAVRSTSTGAPFRAITVRDTIGELPAVKNGASTTTMEYKDEPVSWFQKKIRGDALALTDHISKEMNELNLIRCQRIPRRPGADWRDLPDEKVRLSAGQVVDLIPWCLPNTAERRNQWKGLFGRLDWEGNFPTSITDPQPMGVSLTKWAIEYEEAAGEAFNLNHLDALMIVNNCNVILRNFVSYNKGQTFRLTLASLLEMGYQVRFGIFEAGAYGVSQSRKRAFIWAASPEETLLEWPEPMHVFADPELKISLNGKNYFTAVRSTSTGAPFNAITIRDTIGDLLAIKNGASTTTMEVRLSNGQVIDLTPWCLPNTAKRHNQWKGLFGRLDWEGNFPTSITDPQPMGKVGMCFHLDQDRILTVCECARSQGFSDSYKFAGNIQHKHRQIGNVVPHPLAFALGSKLKEVVERKFVFTNYNKFFYTDIYKSYFQCPVTGFNATILHLEEVNGDFVFLYYVS